jgi:hypothetical protein
MNRTDFGFLMRHSAAQCGRGQIREIPVLERMGYA